VHVSAKLTQQQKKIDTTTRELMTKVTTWNSAQTYIWYWMFCSSLENCNRMAFLVCENEYATSMHM